MRLDPQFALPASLSHHEAARNALRFVTLELADLPRPREPFRWAAPPPAKTDLNWCGGVNYRGRPTGVWSFVLPSPLSLPEIPHVVLGVRAKGQTYYAVYPVSDGGTEEELRASWMAADWRAFSERERVLDVYRKRARKTPADPRSLYELALVGIVLGSYWLFRSGRCLLTHPGDLREFVGPLEAAVAAAPADARRLSLLAFLHERLAQFPEAARLYAAAAAADPGSEFYGLLEADARVFAGQEVLARQAAPAAVKRLRGRKRWVFGAHRTSLPLHFKESLYKEAFAVRRRVEGLEKPRSDRQVAYEFRRAIEIDRARTPRELRDLIPFVRKWGIGDDASRGYFVERATAKEKAALGKALPPGRRGKVQEWIDSFPPGRWSKEAGVFMYLLEAVEEMGV